MNQISENATVENRGNSTDRHMSAKCRPAKPLRNLYLLGILAGLAIPLCFAMSMLTGETALQEATTPDLWFIALSPLFSVLCGLLLIAHFRRSIEVDESGILFFRSPFIRWCIALPHVSSIAWDSVARSAHLTADDRLRTIRFDPIDRADQVELIRSIRSLVPEQGQDGWPRFCRMVALPVRKRIRFEEPLEEGEWRYRGRRMDVVFAVSTVTGFILVTAMWILFSLPKLLLYPLVLVAIWPFVRFFEEPGRHILKRSKKRNTIAMGILAGVTIISLSSMAVLQSLESQHRDWYLIGIASTNLLVVTIAARLLDRRKNEENSRLSLKSAEHWEALERGLAAR
jgi:hypothetical protein